MIFEEENMREFWKIRNKGKGKEHLFIPRKSKEIPKPYTYCNECGVGIYHNEHLKHGHSLLCMFCFSHTVDGAKILKGEKNYSAEDVIQAADECVKESQRNGAPMTDEDTLNLVKNS